ncbi:MAG: GNAT family N-acetyltransferase [Chitinophagaceae bacterium]|nr:GNAT family N-acetyltransferase [Chitinophagaceae bacterium]
MIIYRLATRDDNQQLLELTALSGMQGEISLRIDRKPNFFDLLEMRGKSNVFVALDEGVIIGSLSASLQEVYVGGTIYPLHYIGDFKVAENYQNRGVGLQLCNELANHAVPAGADLAFLNVSKGNSKPFSFFKDRPSIPDFENIGLFIVTQFPGKKNTIAHPIYKVEAAKPGGELLRFFNLHYSQYQLGPVITLEKLSKTSNFIVRDNNGIVAAMSLTDNMHCKQNVVTRLSFKMKYLLKVLTVIGRNFSLSPLPILHQPVKMLYIRFLAVNNHDRELTRLLVNFARNIAYEKSYSFASIGLHEKDPLNVCFRGFLKLSFKSVGMLVTIKNNKELIDTARQGIPFEDYSLV